MTLVLKLCFAFWATTAQAGLVDLNTFTTDTPGSVQESGGTVTFTENPVDGAYYFYNDSFAISPGSTISFDYNFSSDGSVYGDYFRFTINGTDDHLYLTDSASGHFALALSGYSDPTISIEWALIYAGLTDLDGNICPSLSTASVSNIRLDSTTGTAPVPEPGTLLLFGTGLAGLARFGRNRKF